MGYNICLLAEAVKLLRSKGIDGVVVGSTVYMIKLRIKELEDDIDIFTTTISPTIDEDLIAEFAEDHECVLGQNFWGGPQLKCMINNQEVTIELHENIYDYYIPPQIVNECGEVEICGVNIKLINLEDYLVLKAKAGREKDLEDLRYLSDLISRGKLKVSLDKVMKRINLFGEEAGLITRRLKQCGILT